MTNSYLNEIARRYPVTLGVIARLVETGWLPEAQKMILNVHGQIMRQELGEDPREILDSLRECVLSSQECHKVENDLEPEDRKEPTR